VVCLCAHFDAIDTRTRVVFLQHPREHEVPINSARLAHRSLRHSSLHVGVDFSTDRAVTRALSDPAAPAIVLFPSPNARDVRREPPRGPVTLVVLDGTWSQAEKLLRANPMLSTLPHYAFVPTTASNYRIRRQPAEHCVATIEAIAEVLALLEDRPVDGARLLAPFHAMVEYQLAYAARFAGTRSRHVHARRAPRERPIPPLLAEPSPRALVVYGEANAWPHHAQGTPPPSIVHWVAERLATGERFEALIRPDDAVAPATPYHTGLAAEAIACGEEHEAFLSRWSRFAR
jgi:DTW domain-containing protein YfiP